MPPLTLRRPIPRIVDKISRRTFTVMLFLATLAVLEMEGVELEDLEGSYR